MEDNKYKNIFLEMRGVEPRTFIMHRLTLYQLSYIPIFCLLSYYKRLLFFCMEEKLKKKNYFFGDARGQTKPCSFIKRIY